MSSKQMEGVAGIHILVAILNTAPLGNAEWGKKIFVRKLTMRQTPAGLIPNNLIVT